MVKAELPPKPYVGANIHSLRNDSAHHSFHRMSRRTWARTRWAPEMQQRKFISETEVMSTAEIFKLGSEDALRELNEHIRVCRIYARAKNLSFLAYLLNMAEMEARRLGDEAPA